MLLGWMSMGRRLKDVLHLSETPPRRLAASLAIGIFISCTPFYGLHTLMAIGAAHLFRVNKVATVTGAWLNLPWFAPFVYGVSVKVGDFILTGGEGVGFLHDLSLGEISEMIGVSLTLDHLKEGFLAFSRLMFEASMPLFVGTAVVGAVLAGITYVVALVSIRRVRNVHDGAAHAGRE